MPSFHERIFPAGDFIVRQHHPVSHLGILCSGSARVVIVDRMQETLDCGRLYRGDLAFDIAFWSGAGAGISIVSIENTGCLMMQQKDFLTAIERYPLLKQFFYNQTVLGIRCGYEIFCGRLIPESKDPACPDPKPPYIKKAIDYITDNYSQPITLEMVARNTGMSRYHFSRLFKQQMGISFKRYLNRTRIQKAKALLSEHRYNVTEVCYAVGFNDASYFSRVFRKEEGSSPKRFLVQD